MCKECYIASGEPKIINDRVLKAVELINAVYEISCVGGNLHVVLDDWNTDMVEQCLEFINNEEEPEKKAVELLCYNHIVRLSEDELITALAIQEKMITLVYPG